MKKLQKLKLHNLEEICVEEQESLKGGGEWVTINGQSYYMLDEVEVAAHAPINWACSREHGVIINGFVLEGSDGSGGLFGDGQHFGHLQEEDKQALLNIGASILLYIYHVIDPMLIGGADFWSNYNGIGNGSDTQNN